MKLNVLFINVYALFNQCEWRKYGSPIIILMLIQLIVSSQGYKDGFNNSTIKSGPSDDVQKTAFSNEYDFIIVGSGSAGECTDSTFLLQCC